MASLCVLTIWSPICRGLRIVSGGGRAEAVSKGNTANHFRTAPQKKAAWEGRLTERGMF